MVSKETLKKLKELEAEREKKQRQEPTESEVQLFLETVAKYLPNEYRKEDLATIFRKAEVQAQRVMYRFDGPQWSEKTFKKYMSAARKFFIFHVPMKFAMKVNWNELSSIKKAVAEDHRDIPEIQKLEEARIALQRQKRKNYPSRR